MLADVVEGLHATIGLTADDDRLTHLLPDEVVARLWDLVAVRGNSRNKGYFKDRAQLLQAGKEVPGWLNLNVNDMSGAVLSEPSREEVEIPLNEQLIVEYYSR